jgi:uncharacterized protein
VPLYVKEIWRYPVKSMAGEQLERAYIGVSGVDGDRAVLVRDSGRVVTARTHPALLGHRGTISADGTPLVDGRPWMQLDVLADIRGIAGPQAELIQSDTNGRFDILPLLVVTDGAIREFGRDGRRLRPNLVIGGVDGLEERTWPGRRLCIGDLIIHLDSLRGRCIVTTYDPETVEHDPSVLRDIVARFQGKLAINSAVERGGFIHVEQPVELL